MLKALLKRKLLEEIDAEPNDIVWQTGKDGERYSLVLTPAGWTAIGVEPPQNADTETQAAEGDRHKALPKTGTALGKLVSLLGRKNGANIEEAIKAYTWNAAYASFDEQVKGSLCPGLLADLTIFGANLRDVPPETLGTVAIDHTIADGEVVFSRT